MVEHRKVKEGAHMGDLYSQEEREEALKLADEIGTAAAARRLGINVDTLYGWRGRRKKKQDGLEQELASRSEADLMAENAQLRAALRQAQQDVEILQEALGFFAKRRKK